MFSCDFCSRIYDYYKLMNTWHRDRDDKSVVCITFDKDDNTYSIWQQCEDDFYSDNVTTINYCPKCGRKLND